MRSEGRFLSWWQQNKTRSVRLKGSGGCNSQCSYQFWLKHTGPTHTHRHTPSNLWKMRNHNDIMTLFSSFYFCGAHACVCVCRDSKQCINMSSSFGCVCVCLPVVTVCMCIPQNCVAASLWISISISVLLLPLTGHVTHTRTRMLTQTHTEQSFRKEEEQNSVGNRDVISKALNRNPLSWDHTKCKKKKIEDMKAVLLSLSV